MKTHKLTKDNFPIENYDSFYQWTMDSWKDYQNGLVFGSNLIKIGDDEILEIVNVKDGYIEIKIK